MNSKFYTKKSFLEKYNDPGIKDFFNHIERYTAPKGSKRLDFYRFYGIPEQLIKAPNKYYYRIPYESAPLLAAMIRSFTYACGYDGRGRSKESHLKFSYKQYHLYIESLQSELKKLPPYQSALIRNYCSYDNTKTADQFIPILIDRISVFFIALFSYGRDQNCDYLISAIELFENGIESLFRRRLEQKETSSQTPQEAKAQERTHVDQEYSFEKAVGDVFRLFADDNYVLPTERQVFSTELVHHLLAVKRSEDTRKETSIKDWKTFHKEGSARFLQAYNEYKNSHQDKDKAVTENIYNLKTFFETFNTAESYAERLTISAFRNYRAELYEAISIVANYQNQDFSFSLSEIVNQITENAVDALRAAKWLEFDQNYQCLLYLEKYKYELNDWINSGYDIKNDLHQFFDEWANSESEILQNSARLQSKLSQDKFRQEANAFYELVKTAENFKDIKPKVEEIIAELIPSKLTQ